MLDVGCGYRAWRAAVRDVGCGMWEVECAAAAFRQHRFLSGAEGGRGGVRAGSRGCWTWDVGTARGGQLCEMWDVRCGMWNVLPPH